MSYVKIWNILLIFLFSISANAQEKYLLQGRVLDDGRGRGVPDVYVALLKTNRGFSTNARGIFSLKLTKSEFNSDVFFSCAGYYDTIVSFSSILESEGIIKLRARKIEIEDIDVYANFEEELCFGDTTYMYSSLASDEVPYYTEYGHSVGVIIKNRNIGLLDRVYVKIANDEFYAGRFALRFKKVYNEKGYLPWQSLNRYHDIIPKSIVVEAASPGVVCLDISSFKGFVGKKYDILVLIYPLEAMLDMSDYSAKQYAVRERSKGSTNVAIEHYGQIYPKRVHTVFLFNDTYIVAKAMPTPQISLVLKTIKKEKHTKNKKRD